MGNKENGEDSSVPSWINAEFLKEILSEDLKKDISIVDFFAKRALPVGENYLSILYRVEVEYKENSSNDIKKYFLIIKSLPEGEVMQRVLQEMKGFFKECYMYTDVLPTMYKVIKTAKGDVQPLSPRRLTCSKDDVIVMEDLKYAGYKMGMRKEGLDLDHCKITVRTLARFHAASIALYKMDPSLKDKYQDAMYRNEEKLRDRSKKSMNTLANVVETWEGYEKYGDKLRKIGSTAIEMMMELVKRKNGSFNVLNHGDCWLNNMLFRYNSETGKVEDVRFVDFQIARFCSPTVDLQYFMCNCPSDEVRFDHRETLLEEYYSELSAYCKDLNVSSELITLEQLKQEFEEKNMFGFITACTILCVILAEAEDVPDLKNLSEEELEEENVFLKHAVSRKRYRDIFQRLLVFYEKKGIL